MFHPYFQSGSFQTDMLFTVESLICEITEFFSSNGFLQKPKSGNFCQSLVFSQKATPCFVMNFCAQPVDALNDGLVDSFKVFWLNIFF